MLRLTAIRALWPEKEGFSLLRPDTGEEYIFLHFLTPAEIKLHGAWQKVKKGACYIVSAHSEQGLRTVGCPLLHDWFHLQGDVPGHLAACGLAPDVLYYPENDAFLTDLVRELEQEQQLQALYVDSLIPLYIDVLFFRLARALSGNTAPQNPRLYRRFCAIRSEALLAYENPPTVPQMAEKAGLSPSRFHLLYKQYFGLSPASDLADARIEHAKRMLLSGNDTVSAVAEALGYTSVYHFIRQFRRKTGKTPGEYRKG